MIWFVLAFVAGAALTAIVSYCYVADVVVPESNSKVREEERQLALQDAARSGYGKWEFDNPNRGTVYFSWFSRKEIAERYNAEQAELAALESKGE